MYGWQRIAVLCAALTPIESVSFGARKIILSARTKATFSLQLDLIRKWPLSCAWNFVSSDVRNDGALRLRQHCKRGKQFSASWRFFVSFGNTVFCWSCVIVRGCLAWAYYYCKRAYKEFYWLMRCLKQTEKIQKHPAHSHRL